MLKLDKDEFLDEETGLEYLLREMDKQAKEEPIILPSNEIHNQEHLEGWKQKREVSTLTQWREEVKGYDGLTENEIL